jgi:hypothetical protein
MPIEIRELHIRVAVNAPPNSPGPAGGAGNIRGDGGAGEKDEIIAECVEQVLNILQSKRDR